MIVDVFRGRRVKLNNRLIVIEEQGFDRAHFIPRWATVATILQCDRNVIPPTLITVRGNHVQWSAFCRQGWDSKHAERITGIAVVTVLAIPPPKLFWEFHRP